jgi:Tetratrico peptide repeat
VEVWKAVPVNQADWEQRLADAWASIDQLSDEQFLALIERLTAELPTDSGVGLFERAASLDSTGHADLAVPLYRQALQQGLTGERRRRAVIQLASSLRNLGQPEESITLLTRELDAGADHLDDAVRAFLALPWWTLGGRGRRPPWRLRHWRATFPATSARWPTTPDTWWRTSPDSCRCPLPKLSTRTTVLRAGPPS